VTLPDVDALAHARYARVQSAMARRKVGALLLATPHLAAFASGARRVQIAGSGGSLPWVFVAAGAPSAVVFTTDPDGAPSWMTPAAVLPLHWDRERQLARIAELLAATDGPVGCDVWSPAVRAVVDRLGRPLIDAMPVLADAMAGRSAAELDAIRGALSAARAGVVAAAAVLEPGTNAATLVAAASATMSSAASGFPVGEGHVWRTRDLQRLHATDTVLADDVLALEWGVWRGGHAGVAGTTAACRDDLAPGRRRWVEVSCAMAKVCRPGSTTADIRSAAGDAGAKQLGLVAHGLGVGLEPPLVDLAGDDAVELVAGTVLVLAPVVDGYRATRALVVRDGAAHWLEPAP
jgi:Xaa-Pro aminopeptidase